MHMLKTELKINSLVQRVICYIVLWCYDPLKIAQNSYSGLTCPSEANYIQTCSSIWQSAPNNDCVV